MSITTSARALSAVELRALGRDPGRDRAPGRERVAPARLLVAVEQRLVLGVEEQHAVRQPVRSSSSSTAASSSKYSPPRTSETTAARSTFEPSCMNSSIRLPIIPGGRLSTQK